MSNYQKEKEAARQKAQSWQLDFTDRDSSYGELAADQQWFAQLAKRYGLTEEFRENGII